MRFALAILVLLAAGWPGPARAEVEMAFFARDGDGRTFPHAFVVLRGTPSAGGKEVDRAVGFTAARVSIDILAGPVAGLVAREPPSLIARSRRHLSMVLPDGRLRAVEAAIRRWRAVPQPAYHLERRNCVHFVAELARAAGLRVPPVRKYRHDPQAFLAALKSANAAR